MSKGHFVGVDYHKRLLADKVRNEAFRTAIEAQVEPGMVVYDVGTGTGILALLAARAGARRVYAIEPTPIIEVAREVARDNGFEDVITFIAEDARDVEGLEQGDVLISECIGNFFVTDEMQAVIRDAKRFVKPGGVTIPASISLHVAPAWLAMFDSIDFFREPLMGFDMRALIPHALNRGYVIEVPRELLLAEPVTVASFDLTDAPNDIEASFETRITTSATLDGITGWFEADLGAGVTLSTAPGVRTHWAQLVFPVEGCKVKKGDRLAGSVRLTMDADCKSRWRWHVTVERDGVVVEETSHDTGSRYQGGLPT